MESLRSKLERLPASPGCYIFKNKRDEIIYIGKSKCLKNRVKHYFQNVDKKDGKYNRLSKEINDIDLILTATELDALIMECKLIKTHKPQYNAQLKRKHIYPYIKISTDSYPTISLTENDGDGDMHFGCFRNKDAALETVGLINSIWKTPLCLSGKFSDRQKACLQYHLKNCCAPCEKLISEGDYRAKIQEIIKCFSGNATAVLKRLKKEMDAASDALNFEKAAECRDQIAGLSRLMRQRQKLNTVLKGRDVYLFFRPYNETCFSIFYIRDGVTLARADFSDPAEEDFLALAVAIKEKQFLAEDGAFLTACLLDIYADKLYVPIKRKSNTKQIAKILCRSYRHFI
jgi:excinuclease ABC subunit C